MSTLTPANLHLAQAKQTLSRYDSILSLLTTPRNTAPLPDLDRVRCTEIPAAVKLRDPPHITAAELQAISNCKLKRGKFRPTLPKLVAANLDADVVAITSSAFKHLREKVTTEAVKEGLSELCALKGVGPATASYVLAVAAPRQIPVFSDEGYAWVMGTGPGRGEKLKYNAKEYLAYIEAVKKIADVGLTSEEVERIGFVLGKENQGVGSGPSSADADAPKSAPLPRARKQRKGKVEDKAESPSKEEPSKKKRKAEDDTKADEVSSTGRRVLRSRKPLS